MQLYYPISKQSQTILHEMISSKCKKKPAKISWKLWNGKTFPSWLSSFLWTAYHVKTIKYQNNRIIDAVILIHHSFSWNMPHFLEKWQEVRRTLKLEGKCKSRLNSNCNIWLLNCTSVLVHKGWASWMSDHCNKILLECIQLVQMECNALSRANKWALLHWNGFLLSMPPCIRNRRSRLVVH